MPDTALFGHDRLAHLLSDRLLGVPHFQRGYAWESVNVQEFLEDLQTAREDNQSYFMGTIVLAEDPNDPGRKIVVDGQQRLTTTAVLIAAIRDRLNSFGKLDAAAEIDKLYLSTYDLDKEDIVIRLKLNPDDLPTYEDILRREQVTNAKHALAISYQVCTKYITELAPSVRSYRALISIVNQIENSVQVLLAVANGLPEAYVIFETLNDRGADLTTADLLKNYLFSQSSDYLRHVEQKWTKVSSSFDKPDDLVKFIRYEYSARAGKVTTRKLYKALQTDIGRGSQSVWSYVGHLEKTLSPYTALRDTDSDFWGTANVDVRDSLLAFRRFGFESSTPLLLAALTTWDIQRAAKLINKIAAWSVRAWFDGRLGGGTAEEVFCEAAVAISEGRIGTQDDVLTAISRLVPDDKAFKRAFLTFGTISTSRAKYLLAMIEKQYRLSLGEPGNLPVDWSGRSVSIEHIFAESSARDRFDSDKDYERFQGMVDTISNFTLLERILNRGMADEVFDAKKSGYARSRFAVTQYLANSTTWNLSDAEKRLDQLADLAVLAWPAR